MIALPIIGPGLNGVNANPNLEFFSKETSDNVPKAFNALLYFFIGVMIFALLTIHENPEIKINKERNEKKDAVNIQTLRDQVSLG